MLESIDFPYHLIIPAILSIITMLFFNIKCKNQKYKLRLAVNIFIISYFLTLSFVIFKEFHLQWELNQFDINNDGFFTGKELNDKQKLSLNRYVNDTGRTFAPVTSLFSSFLITLLSLLLYTFVIKKRK